MSMFTEREKMAAIEEAARAKLQGAGLHRVKVSVAGNSSKPELRLEADNEEDMRRARALIGVPESETACSETGYIRPQRIGSKIGVVSTPKISAPRISSSDSAIRNGKQPKPEK